MIWCMPPWFSVASQTKNKRKPFGIKRTLMLIMIMVVRAQGDWFGLWFGLHGMIFQLRHTGSIRKNQHLSDPCAIMTLDVRHLFLSASAISKRLAFPPFAVGRDGRRSSPNRWNGQIMSTSLQSTRARGTLHWRTRK